MENLVFITGNHKSGTTLVSRLLDDHPELFSIPIETHIFRLAKYWIDYAYSWKTYPANISIKEFKERIIENFYHCKNENLHFDEETEKIRLRNHLLEREKFIEYFDKPAKSIKEVMLLYFKAIYYSKFEQELDKKIIVEKSVEHAEMVPIIKKLFPEAKIIRIIRNPYSNLASMRRALVKINKKQLKRSFLKKIVLGPKGSYPKISKLILSLKRSYYYYYRNKELFPDDYKVVKYEDLVRNPEEILKEIAEFIGITYNEEMLKPTVFGNFWAGNSSRGLKFKGISSKNLELWKNDIKNIEAYYITKYFKFILDEFNYEILDRKIKWKILPAKNEWFLTWLLNRTFEYNEFK